MARSGTTLTGELVNSSPDIMLFPETGIHSTPSQIALLNDVRGNLQAQPWRNFTPESIDGRVLELLRRIWGTVRDPDRFDDEGQPRFGLKQPHAEEWASEYAESLGPYRPQYVYTIRDPAAIYHSTMRMSAWGDYGPDEFTDRFLASVATATDLAAAGDLFVVDVFRATANPTYRKQLGSDLFEFLELPMSDFSHRVLERWPDMNRSGGTNKGEIPDQEIEQRVKTFQESLKFPELVGAIERLTQVDAPGAGR